MFWKAIFLAGHVHVTQQPNS